MKFINKNTLNDKWRIVSNAVDNEFSGEDRYSYLLDMDDEYVYFVVYDYEMGESMTQRSAYSYNGTKATFEGELQEVVRTTEYKVVETEDSGVERAMLKFFKKYFAEPKSKPLQSMKQFNEEKMEALEYIYVPYGEDDLVGDTYSDEKEVYKMVDHINEGIANKTLAPNLFHKKDVDPSKDFEFIKAWVNEVDCEIDGNFVPQGSPIIKVKFHNEKLWEMRKSGRLNGLSIGAYVDEVTDLEE